MTRLVVGNIGWPDVVIPEDGDVHTERLYHDMHQSLADRTVYIDDALDTQSTQSIGGDVTGAQYLGGGAVLEETVAAGAYSATVQCVLAPGVANEGDTIWLVGALTLANLTPTGQYLSLVNLAGGITQNIPYYSTYVNDQAGATDEHVIPINHTYTATYQDQAMGLDIRVLIGSGTPGSVGLMRPWQIAAIVMRAT